MFPVLFRIGPIVISTYGVLLVIAFFTGAFLVWKKGREEHFGEEELFDVTLLSVFWGVLGARAVYVLVHFTDFGWDLLKWVGFFRYPGLEFFGGLAAATVVVAFFCKAKKWGFLEITDILVVGLALAQVVVFLGAFLNGSGYGIVASLPWAVSFPGVEGKRHPTQLYGLVFSAILSWLVVRVLAAYRTYEWYRSKSGEAASGLVTAAYLGFSGVLWLFLGLLQPSSYYLAGLSWQVWVSVALLLAGLVLGYGRSKRDIKTDIKRLKQLLVKKQAVGDKEGEIANERPDSKEKSATMDAGRRKKRRKRHAIVAGMDVR